MIDNTSYMHHHSCLYLERQCQDNVEFLKYQDDQNLSRAACAPYPTNYCTSLVHRCNHLYLSKLLKRCRNVGVIDFITMYPLLHIQRLTVPLLCITVLSFILSNASKLVKSERNACMIGIIPINPLVHIQGFTIPAERIIVIPFVPSYTPKLVLTSSNARMVGTDTMDSHFHFESHFIPA